jgi:hypothetical protein
MTQILVIFLATLQFKNCPTRGLGTGTHLLNLPLLLHLGISSYVSKDLRFVGIYK